jgi:hypothetical protein
MAREPAERTPGLRPDDTVDRDVRTLLKPANCLRRCRAVEPVDRTVIEAVRTQADLEGGNARIGRRGAGSERCDDKDQGQSEKRPGMHGRTVFAMIVAIP